MEQRNVTVTLPADLLREARHLAVDHGVSLSRFIAMVLEERVEVTRRCRTAWERQRRLLDEGLPLGTLGEIAWSREALHGR
jgi:hypothetical protein